MFRVGLNNAVKFNDPVEDFLESIKGEFNAAELICDFPGNLPSDITPERRKVIKNMCEENDIRISVHSVYLDINPVSVVPEVRNFAAREIKKAIKLASDIGAGVVTIHAGYLFHWWRLDLHEREVFFKNASEIFPELGDFAFDHNVILGIENGSWFIGTPKINSLGDKLIPIHFCIDPVEHFDFLNEINHKCVGVTFDISKSFCSGNNVLEHYKLLSKKVVNVHLANMSEIDVDLKPLFLKLKKDYSGNIVSETGSLDVARSNKEAINNFLKNVR